MTNLNSESEAYLFLGNFDDTAFLPRLKPLLHGNKCFVDTKPISTWAEVEIFCKSKARNITKIISTSHTLLKKITGKDKVSIDNYAGSYFKKAGIEIVFVSPLEHTVTVPYGTFLLSRYISKLTHPENWLTAPGFKWRIVNENNYEDSLTFLSECSLIAVDIETLKLNLAIRCVGFTGIKYTSGGFESHSFVVPLNSDFAYDTIAKFLAIPGGKIFQNGKYDLAYLTRYNLYVHNYLWDTATAFHCWYSELPKDLAFLQGFFVREASYWKDLAESNDLEEYYLYNAKDTWATASVLLAWIHESPAWAKNNYIIEFPQLFPCHLSEMTGIKRNQDKIELARKQLDSMTSNRTSELNRITGVDFNVNSPKQMKALLTVLGCGDLPNTSAQSLDKAAFRHPFTASVINLIRGTPKSDIPELMGIRSMRKAKSTYLRTNADADKDDEGGSKEYNGRLLYALNPHGTDTGRLASREHHFWCGFNIQNQPSGSLIKQTFEADDGFLFGESDLEQAETRDTAYITGEEKLIAAVNSGNDFHSTNVELFFGIPYAEVYDNVKKKVLNKPIRDIGKRVNHGANYNMGARVLVDTMGLEKIFAAARMLKLPRHFDAIDIATFLLAAFDRTYPTIRGEYQVWVISQVVTNKLLTGATGWTRYCFSDPRKNKQALNSYVAHSPQSLNAMVLNKAYLKVFTDIAISEKHSHNFKLLAQIHDSIFFQYRIGHEYLGDMVKERMEIPIMVTDIRGKKRKLCVPAALKIGAKYWSEL